LLYQTDGIRAAADAFRQEGNPASVRLSVIIPVYNGEGVLDRCLERLQQSTFRDYECIVVDDASTDGSCAIAARYGVSVLALEHNGGPARARNRGAERARGEILLFLDADVCVHPETLAQVDAYFRAHPAVDALMGSYDDTPTEPGFVSQYKNLFHHYVHHVSRAQAWTFWAGCGAIRREVFLAAGGFDESYTRPCIEDIELGFRLRTHGRRIDLDPAIQVTHLKRWTLSGLLRSDLFDRGIPWFRLMLRDRTMPADLNVTGRHRLSVVLVFAAVLLCAAFFIKRSPLPLVLLTAAIGLLVYLNLDLYRFFARKRGLRFAAQAIPLHWLYYGYCGVVVGAGLSLHLWDKLRPQRRRLSQPWLDTR
jgi:glycosyltransferase involved in cell wall biosynthesis